LKNTVLGKGEERLNHRGHLGHREMRWDC